MKPIPLEEREYREGLYHLERRAIIPLKCALLVVTLLLIWLAGGDFQLPVFMLFFVYGLTVCFQIYSFFYSTITLNEVKPFVLASFLFDVVFVAMLIYFDLVTNYFDPQSQQSHEQFYVLCFLLVMRGFALFKTLAETVIVNLLLSILYLVIVYIQIVYVDKQDFRETLPSDFAIRMILIWFVILMSWFIVMVINRQKLELMEMHDQLLRAEGLARVGELAAGVAHEINNPIGIIATTAEYLKKIEPENNEEWREEISAIQNEAMRCKQIVQEMLTYANPRPANRVPVKLDQLNEEVLSFVFKTRRDAGHEVLREYANEIPLIEADPNLVKQALLNIYINARQAIPENTHGLIVTRIHGRQYNRLVRIEIEDNGAGIAEADIDQIFNPFFTRKPKGTGLGLSVTQRIIETLGGTIAVRPAEDQGTVFVIEFPALRG